jgi:membrane protein required for colicin V production
MSFAAIDVVFAILIVVLAVRGAIRGFVAEFGSVAALFLGLGGAIALYKSVGALMDKWFGSSLWNPFIAFLVVFLLIYLLVKALERLLAALFDRLELERLDRAIGLFLGLAEGLLLVGVLLILLNWQPFFETRGLLGDSLFARFLSPVLPSPERLFGHV